jgi:hypothetical protein
MGLGPMAAPWRTVQFQDSVVGIGAQAVHAGQGMADGGGERGFARDRGELHRQPALQIVEDRGGMGASQLGAAIWRGASGLFLDGMELGDPADGFFSDG